MSNSLLKEEGLMRKIGMITVFAMIILMALTQCSNVENKKYDKIFWDFHFGMTRQAFFDSCMSLNDINKVRQGNKNTSVAYLDSTNFKGNVDVNFYPKFNSKDQIHIMPVRYNYIAWAPWNKNLFSDSLLLEVVELLEESDNISFKKGKPNLGRNNFVYSEGPLRIMAISEDDYYVKVVYENVNYED